MKKRQAGYVAVTMLLAVSVSGCCSLFRESNQLVKVDSKPQGAVVKVGEAQGRTPFEITMSKGKEYVISATLAGETKSQTLNRRIDGLYWVNILVWPGLIVDAITGKMFVYDPIIYTFDFNQK